MLLTKGLFLVVWAWVLNWLCSKGFKAISWIIVLLPFIFFLFLYFLIKDVVVVKEGASFNIPAAIKPAPGSGGGGIQQLTPAQKEAAAKAAAEKAAAEKAAAEKAAAEKAAAEKAVADAQAAKDAADKVAADKAAVLAKCMADRDKKCQGARACLKNTKC